MTAIGLLLITAAYFVAKLDEHYSVPDVMQAIAGLCILVGFPLTAAGVTTWLWRVMP